MAILLLTLTLRLNAHQWAFLFADALVLALLYRVVQRRAASQIHPHMLGPYVRGWPLRWINLGVLTLAFFILSFFVLGAPDLRQESWQTVAEHAFQSGREVVACPWIGTLVGASESLEQGSWSLAQHYIPELPHAEWRLAAWAFFLLQLGLLSLLYTRLLLGVLTLSESRQLRAETVTGESALAKTFILTILVLALPSLYAALRLQDVDPSQFEPTSQNVLTWIDPCRGSLDRSAETQAALDTTVIGERDRLIEESGQRIDEAVEQIFVPVTAAVDEYLDWYFTVVGEYERLAALVVGDFPQLMADQLDTRLFEATDFHARMHTLDQTLLDESLARVSGLSQTVKDHIEAQASADPCVRVALNIEPLARLDRDVWRAGAAAGGGAAVGGAILSQKIAAAVIAKVGAKKSVQVAAVMGAKLVAKKSGGTVAAALGGVAVCSPSGPVAVVCGVGAGLIAWFTIDKIAIEIDEAVSREDMRADILEVLAKEKEALKQALRQQHASLIGYLVENIKSTVDGVFIPARDGW
ncbi:MULTISPECIES: hypothetical protein [unclassified Thiocapsa]|uniref:hypothetical protein n=1 Tax=unclassified Thiocapsa TaxID=2641286 RepID=UPI0035B2EF2E